MSSSTEIVPMPRWSTPLGCTKLFICILVLAFTATCCALWGGYPAFGLSVFTASLSLIAFGYYIIAISFKPSLYNKWAILTLESLSMVFWFVSLVLLAGWSAASAAFPFWTWNAPTDTDLSYGTSVNLNQRDVVLELGWASPVELMRRQRVSDYSTPIRYHGEDTHKVTYILASISAGLSGLNFILYCVTLCVYASSMTKRTVPTPQSLDEEEDIAVPVRVNTGSSDREVQPGTPKPPAVTEPLRVNTLPKDFEPKPQSQEHYLNPEDAAQAGIEPPTPVLKAQIAEKEKEKERLADGAEEADKAARRELPMPSPISPLQAESVAPATAEEPKGDDNGEK